MATIAPTMSTIGLQDGSLMKFVWTLAGTDDGAPINFAEWADRSVQFVGTFSTGAVVFEGSNDGGTNYFTLTDASNLAISKTTNALSQITECVEKARPRAATAVTSVVVTLIVRRAQPLRT